MELYFLGGLFPNSPETDGILRAEKGNAQYAANLLQRSIVNGLDKNLRDSTVTVINAMYIGAFPVNNKKLLIPRFEFRHAPGAGDINCGFFNLMGYKHVSRYLNVKAELFRRLRKDNPDNPAIVAYAMHTPLLYAAVRAKKMFGARVLLICPDLPEFMDTGSRPKGLRLIYRICKAIDTKLLYGALGHVDCFVFLTEQMSREVNKNNRPFCVVEGIADSSIPYNGHIQNNGGETVVAYTGTMHERYGIKKLLDAFLLCGSRNLRLELYGRGDFENQISKYERKDPRIKYYGGLPQEEIFRKQSRADILINPRQNTETYTRFSFPSKIMEYMLSGKPVLCYRLDGIPTEYDEYLIYVPDNSTESLAREIERLAGFPKDRLAETGRRNREFVLREKNEYVQAEKILDTLKKTMDNG